MKYTEQHIPIQITQDGIKNLVETVLNLRESIIARAKLSRDLDGKTINYQAVNY